MLPLYFILAAAGGYLLGSIPFGLVLTKAAGLGDIRTIGSGNIGATNVLRTGRKDLALATLLLDAGKAGIALFLARLIAGNDAVYEIEFGLVAGFAAFIGHCYPVWLQFKGGKGVAGIVTSAARDLIIPESASEAVVDAVAQRRRFPGAEDEVCRRYSYRSVPARIRR